MVFRLCCCELSNVSIKPSHFFKLKAVKPLNTQLQHLFTKMSEARILNILSDNRSETTETLDYPRLSLDSVQHISKNIADMMYNSLTTKSTPSESKRLNILLLLQKWCSNKGSHLQIGDNNYNCVIELLNPNPIVDDGFELEITLDECKEIHGNVTETIIKHYNKIERINIEKSNFIRTIKDRDRKRFRDNSTFVPSLLPNPKSDTLFDLKRLTELKGCENIIPIKKVNKAKTLPLKSKEQFIRQKQISLGYALLNLNRSDGDISMLRKILNNLHVYENLQPYEIKFVNFLWLKLGKEDFPLDISLQLLQNFSFIYEKVLINMCTDALRTNTVQSVLVVSKEVQRMLQVSAKSERMENNIKNLFYELYAYSRFNNKLACYFNLIR